MAGDGNLEIDQGTDFGLQFIWTDQRNEGYKVVHPMRLQARAATGQVVLDLTSVDQTTDQAAGSDPRITYSTETGVMQVFVPAAHTANIPSGTYYYDMFVSYESSSINYLTNEASTVVRTKKLIGGKLTVEGRVTKYV